MIIPVPNYDWIQWQAKYRTGIRVLVEWELLRKKPPTVKQLWWTKSSREKVFYPWYKGGTWLDGKPIEVSLGENSIILRVPAVMFRKNRFLVLDGCHRIRDLKPRILILDYLKTKQLRPFLDLFNTRHMIGR